MKPFWRRWWAFSRADLPPERLPRHLAIIMDGNGRWANRRGLPRVAGHKAGVDAFRRIVTVAAELGIPVLTVYAFSTENWRRPEPEVQYLMTLLATVLEDEVPELHRQKVRIRIIGRRNNLSPEIIAKFEEAEKLTAQNSRLTLNIAFNYGGRAEITDACREIARMAVSGEIKVADISEETIAGHLYTSPNPDPDLIIRTGGNMRLSNFLLWQSAYSEIHVTSVYWPDFGREELLRALDDYARRERRFGQLTK